MTANGSVPELLLMLRGATAGEHESIERMARKLGVSTSLEALALHLGLLAAHHRALLAGLQGFEPWGSLLAARLSEIERDLACLPSPRVELLTSVSFPAQATAAQMLGMTYVTEGARLGGPTLARELRANAVDTSRLASLDIPLASRRQRWQWLVQQLCRVEARSFQDVTDGASRTFSDLCRDYESMLSRCFAAGWLRPASALAESPEKA